MQRTNKWLPERGMGGREKQVREIKAQSFNYKIKVTSVKYTVWGV